MINPALRRPDLARRYARDLDGSRTLGELVEGLHSMIERGASNEDLVEYLDREFLYGAWKHVVESLPWDGGLFLADVRGLVIETARRGRERA